MLVLKPELDTDLKHDEGFLVRPSGQVRVESHPRKKALQLQEKEKCRGEVIGKLASSFYYVEQDSLIKDIVEELNENPKISAVGVVNNKHEPIGILVRKHLFDLIGKRFGRELIENKSIEEILEKQSLDLLHDAPCFHHDQNILSVVEEIQTALQDREIVRFIVNRGEGKFGGVFTNIDVLFYLSSITQADMKIAQNLQSSIVKNKEIVRNSCFEAVAGSKMAKGVGGDFYLMKPLDDQNWILSLCDVSGKGVSAALITTLLGGLFSIYNFRHGLSNFIRKLNEYVFHSFQMEKYLTGLFVKFDPETGKTLIYDMGHAYLYVYRQKKLHQIKSSEQNFPVGITQDLNPAACSFTLKSGDILLAFTDGIPEQCNERNEEYGVERISSILEENQKERFEEVSDLILADLKRFRGKEPQHDDITFFILKYL